MNCVSPSERATLIVLIRTRFLSADRDRQKTRPLAGPRRSPDSQLRSGYALPSDGFLFHPSHLPGGLDDFVALVIPELVG